MVRNHDLLGATDAERPGAEEVGVLPFRILPRSRSVLPTLSADFWTFREAQPRVSRSVRYSERLERIWGFRLSWREAYDRQIRASVRPLQEAAE